VGGQTGCFERGSGACCFRRYPALFPLLPLSSGGAAWWVPTVRASNEGLPRPRVARAQGIARLTFIPFFSLYSFSPVLEGVAKVALDCAHRTSTVSPFTVRVLRARRAPGRCLTALDPRSPTLVQYLFLR